MKVYCNVDLIGRSDDSTKFLFFLPRKQAIYSIVDLYFFLKKLIEGDFDCLLIFNANLFYMLTCYCYRLLGGRGKIVYFDLLLKKPFGIKQTIIARIKTVLLRSVDCFFFVHRDLSEYTKYYGIAALKSRYIPFKSNNYEIRNNYLIRDEGYILSCGVSHRDYKTLFKAIDGLNVNVKIVLPDLHNIKFHKSVIDLNEIPQHVEIITHDFNKDSWNKILSGATFVIIPISVDSIQPSGISVYLESMMFKKPVIISGGPSTNNILEEGQACIVERGSADSLRSAILMLLDNHELRNKYALNGYEYACKLQGVDRLVADIKAELLTLTY